MFRRLLFSLSVMSLSIAAANAAESLPLDTPRLSGIDTFAISLASHRVLHGQ